MAMKKKFFGLALAGAMAFSSTGVYANTIQKGEDVNKGLSHTIPVTGVIKGDQGGAPAGRIEVVVPTAMEFSVAQDGTFTSANNYEIENKSAFPIKVEVAAFSETNPTGDIMLKGASDDLDKRSDVRLYLIGHSTQGEGLVLTSDVQNEDLTTVGVNGTSHITLNGEVGSGDLGGDTGISEKFNLTLKISKQ